MFIKKPYFESGGPGDGGAGGGDAGLKFETVEAAIAALEKDHGLTIRNKDQETEFQTNLQKQIADEKTREIFSTFENEIERVSGVKREDNEKAYDFLNRTFSTVGDREKALSGQVDEMTTKIKALQADGGTVAQVDELNKQLATLKDMHKTELKKREDEITGMKTAQFQATIDNNINNAVNRYRPDFDKEKGEAIIEPFITAQTIAFKQAYKPVESNGVIIWHQRDTDKPMLDTKSGNPLGAYDLLDDMLKPILKEKRTQSGAGGDGGAGDGGGDNGAFVLSPPDTVKTKTELINWMRTEKNLDNKTPEFNKYYSATVAAKKIERV